MNKTWRKIHKTRGAQEPALLESLRDGASEDQIAEAQRTMNVEFPDDYIESLRVHDGQNDEQLYDYWRLLPLHEVCTEAAEMRHLLDAGEFDGLKTNADKKVQAGWWRRDWIPVMADGFGDFICLDMGPGRTGKPGQVVEFLHDDAERRVLSRGFKAFLQKVARELGSRPPEALSPVLVGEGDREHLFRNPKQAQVFAVRGHSALALAALEQFHAQGSASAAASIVYLQAYLGNWQAVLDHAAPAVSDVDAFPHRNVPVELAALVSRAGAETGDWAAVARIAEVLPSVYGHAHEWLTAAAQAREDAFSRQLAGRKTAPPSVEECAQQWADYERRGVPSTYSQNEASRRRHRFLMAVQYDQREIALELMKSHPEVCKFDDAVRIASWQEPEPALEAIVSRLASWLPVYSAQVAPAVLLTDPLVSGWMTKEWCRTVLETPRARWWWDFKAH